MDLLFSKYASPLVLLDQMISAGRFCELIDGFVKINNEEMHEKTMWEFFLHKVYDKSFSEFLNESKTPQTAEEKPVENDIEATVKKSMEVVGGFTAFN